MRPFDRTVFVFAVCLVLAFTVGAVVGQSKLKPMPSVSEFVVSVPTAEGSAVEVPIVGFATGYNNGCVLVSATGGLATLPGPCPRR